MFMSNMTTDRSKIRNTTLSPNIVGRTLTRKSTGWPPTDRRIRPSCGKRRSAMSRSAMTLIRVVMAKARCRGGGTISYNTPSDRILILNSVSKGSKCKSLACSLIPINNTMFNSRRTGALSANCSTLSRLSTPSASAARAASSNSLSPSKPAITSSTLSEPEP